VSTNGITTSRVRVRYSETDQMGVAYHTHYLVWCEVGRTEYMREVGATYAQLEASGLFLVVAQASVRYLAPARYDDTVRIDTCLQRVQSRAVTFHYTLTREAPGPARLATAMTKLIALGADGAPRSLPDALLRAFRNAHAHA
jgi:acyl-CoA thioester hydrolase